MLVFDMFYVKYQSFFEDIDFKFCTHVHQTLPSNILYGVVKIVILMGKCFEKDFLIFFWEIFEIFEVLKIQDSSFVALLILHHFI